MRRVTKKRPRQRRIPPAVRELVAEAEGQAFFWNASRPGLVPSIGSGMGRMQNIVPSGLPTPTAPSGSAQPVWAGQYAEFLGDDYLSVSFDRSSLAVVSFGVVFASEGNSKFISLAADDGSNTFIEIRATEDDDPVESRLFSDGGGNLDTFFLNQVQTFSDPVAAVSVVTPSRHYLTARTAGAVSTAEDIPNGTFDKWSSLIIGARADFGARLTGGMSACGAALVDISNDQADALRDSLFTRYAPLLA